MSGFFLFADVAQEVGSEIAACDWSKGSWSRFKLPRNGRSCITLHRTAEARAKLLNDGTKPAALPTV
ncbi:hypothetical protein PR003_g26562 [Phytophthora rubi]|uniref:Uncharacterized protein n=1 Tax=Phytophthora rubi TaxID=129364 RepID=A0A6A4C5C2_9STRA|nr:hypothetical protein PR003_g26562 [Phytophthora rubi]